MRALFAGFLLGAWGLGASNAIAFTTGGTVIYNTATAVYTDANNVIISQGPVCKLASSITGPLDAVKQGAAATVVGDRATPSALTQSGLSMQGKAAAPTPRRGKNETSC